ncbi:MAG: LPXTG cell wall anchor domain-containing protein [Oscillospiraceae bacterium]|nr:LPXTG cell wall anchor domain-containing protein [Candidatus Ruminococcus equi]
MIKKVLSLAICVVMVLAMATVAVSAAQVEIANDNADAQAEVAANNETEAGTGAGQVINFDPSGAGWNNYSNIFCYIWVYGGESFTPWQAKASKMTKVSDTEWTYDVSKSGSSIATDGTPYAVIFSNENGMQTYDLLFDSSVLGDTAYCNADEEIENPADSSKTAKPTYWKGQDPAKYGPIKTITSIGNIVGSCIPSTTTPYKMFVDFLKNQLTNAQTYSGKDDQAILDDAAKNLGLYKEDVTKAIEEAGVSVNWDAAKSSLPDGSNPEASESGKGGGGTGTGGGDNGGSNGGGTNGGGSGSSKSGSGSGSTTGQDTTLLFVMLGVLVAAAGVIFFVRKREKA